MPQVQIWTSDLVKETLQKLRLGMYVDMTCFHEKNIELKTGNIFFKLTKDEIDEFHKCSQDIIYFVEKYCRFMTDKGRMIVKLRPYQKKILKLLSEERFIEAIDEYGPKNRNIIINASRQIGKCLFGSEISTMINDKKMILPINFLYYLNKEKTTLLEKLKFLLMRIYYKIEKW